MTRGAMTCRNPIRREPVSFAGSCRRCRTLRGLERSVNPLAPLIQISYREEELKFMQNLSWQIEVDRATPTEWSKMLDLFDDANIYQTSAYGGVRWGEK